MRMLLKDHVENALEALRANRVRTVLTVTGITIGIASITAVLALASGASGFLRGQMTTVAESTALVRSNATAASAEAPLASLQSIQATSTLTEKDAHDIERIPNATVAPMALLHTDLKAKEATVSGQRATLIGSNSNLMTIAKLHLIDGQFIAADSGTSGIVMGYQLAIDLFGTEHAIGNVVTIRNEPFTVIGVLKATKQPVNYLGIDVDNAAVVTLPAIKQFTQDVAQIQQIAIITDTKESLDPIVKQANTILAKNHHEEKEFVILTGDSIVAPSGQLFSTIITIVAIITGISLLIGGIGIMNSMLVNVAERQREVGIRKAIGATDSNIISQFLIESAIVGLIGGILGYLMGILVAFALGFYLPFTPQLDWQVGLICIGIAIMIGTLFGVYPAIRAAKQDPIEALYQ